MANFAVQALLRCGTGAWVPAAVEELLGGLDRVLAARRTGSVEAAHHPSLLLASDKTWRLPEGDLGYFGVSHSAPPPFFKKKYV